jgi:hypothetical protein
MELLGAAVHRRFPAILTLGKEPAGDFSVNFDLLADQFGPFPETGRDGPQYIAFEIPALASPMFSQKIGDEMINMFPCSELGVIEVDQRYNIRPSSGPQNSHVACFFASDVRSLLVLPPRRTEEQEGFTDERKFHRSTDLNRPALPGVILLDLLEIGRALSHSCLTDKTRVNEFHGFMVKRRSASWV